MQYLRFLKIRGGTCRQYEPLGLPAQKAADGPFEVFFDLNPKSNCCGRSARCHLPLTLIALFWCVWNLWFGSAMKMGVTGLRIVMLVFAALLGCGFVRTAKKSGGSKRKSVFGNSAGPGGSARLPLQKRGRA